MDILEEEKIDYDVQRCRLGWVLIAVSRKGVCAVFLGDQSAELIQSLEQAFPEALIQRSQTLTAPYMADLSRWFDNDMVVTTFEWALDLRGTEFQRQVWRLLQTISWGETRSYQGVAAELGKASAVRAVANACASNLVAIAVPCHRVVRQDNKISGYRWGVARKQQLLMLEQNVKVFPN